jgi:AraC-like DNA-binding protein
LVNRQKKELVELIGSKTVPLRLTKSNKKYPPIRGLFDKPITPRYLSKVRMEEQTGLKQNNFFDASPLEFMDLPLDDAHPVVWAINRFAKPTGKHFDIHAGLEIGIVLAGRSRRLYRNFQFDSQPGDVWLVAPWEPHGVQILKQQTHHLVLGVLPEFLGIPDTTAGCDWMRIFRQPPADRMRLMRPGQRKAILELAGSITDILQSTDPYRLAKLRIALQQLLLNLMELSSSEKDEPSQTHDESTGETLLAVLRLVERQPGRKITLADAARAAGMSRTRFAERFHAFTGLTFARYLTRRRLRGVVGDLRGGDTKLQVIAHRWGFADSSHLVRIFRQQAGCTPQVYRQRFKIGQHTHSTHEAGTMPRPELFS